MRGLFELLLENKLHVGLFALASVWAWGRAVRVGTVAWDYLVVPLIVVAIYQWNRLTDPAEDAVNCPAELARAHRHAGAIRNACVVMVSAGLFLSWLTGHRAAVLLAGACVVLGFAYSSPLPVGRRRVGRLKTRFLLKNASGAVGWSAITILYPSAHAGLSVTPPLALGAAVMFLGVWAVEIVWDLRDIAGDEAAGVASLPVRLGAKRARRVGYLLAAGGAALVAAMVAMGAVPALWSLVGLNMAAICLWLRLFADKTARVWSHALVLLQALLLIAMGLLPW